MSKKKIVALFLLSFIVPQLAFASWWNPFSWNIFSWFRKVAPQEQVVAPNAQKEEVVLVTKEIIPEKSINNTSYVNTVYGYSIEYPKDWVMEPERQVVDSVNKLVSLVKLQDKDKGTTVQILVNEKEWLLKYEAPKKESISIAGNTETAYIFPKGYEACDSSAEDCSFFVIPIYKNGLWYELRAKEGAETITNTYKDIFSTFSFVPSSAVTQKTAVTTQAPTTIPATAITTHSSPPTVPDSSLLMEQREQVKQNAVEQDLFVKEKSGIKYLDVSLFERALGGKYKVVVVKEGPQNEYGILFGVRYSMFPLSDGTGQSGSIFEQSSMAIIGTTSEAFGVLRKSFANQFVVEKYAIKEGVAGRMLVSKDGDNRVAWFTENQVDLLLVETHAQSENSAELNTLLKIFPPSDTKFNKYLGHIDYSAPGVIFSEGATTRDLNDFTERKIGTFVLSEITRSRKGITEPYFSYSIGTYVSTSTKEKGTMEMHTLTMHDVARDYYTRAVGDAGVVGSQENKYTYQDTHGTFCFQPNRIVSFPSQKKDDVFVKEAIAKNSLCTMTADKFMKYYGF